MPAVDGDVGVLLCYAGAGGRAVPAVDGDVGDVCVICDCVCVCLRLTETSACFSLIHEGTLTTKQ